MVQQVSPDQVDFGKGALAPAQHAERQGTPGSGGSRVVKFSFGSARHKKLGRLPAAAFNAEQAKREEDEVST